MKNKPRVPFTPPLPSVPDEDGWVVLWQDDSWRICHHPDIGPRAMDKLTWSTWEFGDRRGQSVMACDGCDGYVMPAPWSVLLRLRDAHLLWAKKGRR